MKIFVTILTILSLALNVMGQQSFVIGADAANAQAIFEMVSSGKGMLIPRMSTTDRDNNITGLDATDEGLLIYNLTDGLFNYWDGIQWVPFPSAAAGLDDDWYESLTTTSPTDINSNIFTNGNVGIGTNDPQLSLHVEGDIRIDGNDIYNDPDGSGQNMNLISVGGVSVILDDNTNGSEEFSVKSGSTTAQNVFEIKESGDWQSDGDGTVSGNDLDFDGTSNPVNISTNSSTDASMGLDIESQGSIDMVLDVDDNNPSMEFAIKKNSDATLTPTNKLFSINEDASGMFYPYGTSSGETGGIRFRELSSSGTSYVGLRSPDNLGSNYWLTMPDNAGVSNYLLQTDGTGILSWVDPASIASGGSSDADWYISGGVTAPTSINDNIWTNGNVGIGLNNPAYDLDVDGNVVVRSGGMVNIGTTSLLYPFRVLNTTIRRSADITHNYDGTLGSDALYVVNNNNASSSGFGYVRGTYSIAEKYATSGSAGFVEGAYLYGVNRYTGIFSSDVYGAQTLGYRYGNLGNAYGIRAEAYNENGAFAYGIYATTGNSTATRYAGYFSGDVHVTGNLTWVSDERLKRNFKPLETSLDKILALPVFSYEFRSDEYRSMNLPMGRQSGFIARDLQAQFPELVKATTHPSPSKESIEAGIEEAIDPIDFDAVNYIGLIPHLVKAIQEQQEIIERLEKRIIDLEK